MSVRSNGKLLASEANRYNKVAQGVFGILARLDRDVLAKRVVSEHELKKKKRER